MILLMQEATPWSSLEFSNPRRFRLLQQHRSDRLFDIPVSHIRQCLLDQFLWDPGNRDNKLPRCTEAPAGGG